MTDLTSTAQANAEDAMTVIRRAWNLHIDDPAAALVLAREAAVVASTDSLAALLADITVACCTSRLGQQESSSELRRALQARSLHSGDVLAQCRANYCLALWSGYRQDSAQAARDLQPCLEQAPHLSPIDQVLIYNLHGVCAHELGDTDLALRTFYRVLDAARHLQSPKTLARVLGNIGEMQQYRGNYEEAVKVLAQAYDTLALSAVTENMLMVIEGLVSCHLALGDTQAALVLTQRHVADVGRVHPIRPRIACAHHCVIARVFAASSNWDLARKHLQYASALLPDADDPALDLKYGIALSDVERGQQQWDAALAALTQAQTHLGATTEPGAALDISLRLALTHAALGQWQEAYVQHCKHHALYIEMQGSAARARADVLRVQDELQQQQRQLGGLQDQISESNRTRRAMLNLLEDLYLAKQQAEAASLQRMQTP